MKSLIWLRKKVIKSNKSMVLQVILPLGFAFLYKHIYEIQGSLNNSNESQSISQLFSLIFEFISWKSNQYYCSEEKEKIILRTLLLSGVNSKTIFFQFYFIQCLLA